MDLFCRLRILFFYNRSGHISYNWSFAKKKIKVPSPKGRGEQFTKLQL
jgi:hypothetical protein